MASLARQQTLRQQRTLAGTVSVDGFGYWSGRDVRVEFAPAPPNSGVVFVRQDLIPPVHIPARFPQRVESPRRTVLRKGQASVEMVEHVMAALAGLHIDNCEVRVNEPEIPGCDGSSLDFVKALDSVGFVQQDAVVPKLIVTEPLRVGDEQSWLEALPPGKQGGMWVKFHIDYGTRIAIGRQTCQLTINEHTFRRELAPCRTFVLQEEADWLRKQGLALRPTSKDLLIFDEHGPIDNEVRFEDECVRHKMLDLIGDLALTGCDIEGKFIAHCSGHRLNSEMGKALLLEAQRLGAWRRTA